MGTKTSKNIEYPDINICDNEQYFPDLTIEQLREKKIKLAEEKHALENKKAILKQQLYK